MMRVLTYIRKVLEIYASGDEDYLSRSLTRDIGPDPTPHEEQVHAQRRRARRSDRTIACWRTYER
jgi:hypothetical protein